MAVSLGRLLSFNPLPNPSLLPRTSYILCWAQHKMKMWGPLFKDEDFQDGDGSAFIQVWGPLNLHQSHALVAGSALPSYVPKTRETYKTHLNAHDQLLQKELEVSLSWPLVRFRASGLSHCVFGKSCVCSGEGLGNVLECPWEAQRMMV